MTPNFEFPWQAIDAKLAELSTQLSEQQESVAHEIVRAQQLEANLKKRLTQSKMALAELQPIQPCLNTLLHLMSFEAKELERLLKHAKLYRLQRDSLESRGSIWQWLMNRLRLLLSRSK